MKRLSQTNTNRFKEFSKKYSLPMLKEKAIIKILRDGQQRPSESNNVVAKAMLLLPLGYNKWDLHMELQFMDKLKIFNENLKSSWGARDVPMASREKEKKFSGSTWEQAFNSAMDYTKAELDKLIDVLQERQMALQDAEPSCKITLQELLDLQEKRVKELKSTIDLDSDGCTYATQSEFNVSNENEDIDIDMDFGRVDTKLLKKIKNYFLKVLEISQELDKFSIWKPKLYNEHMYINFKKKINISVSGKKRIKKIIYEIEKCLEKKQELIEVPKNLKHLL